VVASLDREWILVGVEVTRRRSFLGPLDGESKEVHPWQLRAAPYSIEELEVRS
jgi:hypothetical protein